MDKCQLTNTLIVVIHLLQIKFNYEFKMEWRNASRVYMVERVKIRRS